MNIINICPTCHKSITATPLVDIIVTFREDLTRAEIYEQGWHKECYPPDTTPDLLLKAARAALVEMTAAANRDNWDAQTQEYVDAINGLRNAIADVKGKNEE